MKLEVKWYESLWGGNWAVFDLDDGGFWDGFRTKREALQFARDERRREREERKQRTAAALAHLDRLAQGGSDPTKA